MLDRDQVVRDTLAWLPPARLERRIKATSEARALLQSRLGQLDEAALRRVLELFNQDVSQGREVQGRFRTGLVGHNANLLVGNLANVNQIVPQLWGADDAWLAANLKSLRRGGKLPGGGWLFLSMVLHSRDPQRFVPLSSSMTEGLAALEGRPRIAIQTGEDYLEYCRRVHGLLATYNIDPHGVDALLIHALHLGQSDAPVAARDDEFEDLTAAPAPLVKDSNLSPLGVERELRKLLGDSLTVTRRRGKSEEELLLEEIFGREAPPTRTPDPASAATTVTPTPRPESRTIGWLHLTDLHQGMQGSGWLWPNVMAQLFDDLRRLHESCGPWDLVFFTGDLTQRGDAGEFQRLNDTLARLWRQFEKLGSNPRLVCVPGNHDLVRPGALDPVTLALSLWHDRPQLREHVFDTQDNPYRAHLSRAFANYQDWHRTAPWVLRDGIVEGTMPGDFSLSLALHGVELGIVGLNSSFLQLTGEDFDNRLDVDPRQLHNVCDHYPPEWLQRHHINLLLTHHPPEWLAPRSRQEFRNEIDLPGRFVAHFFGHMHEGTATSTRHAGAQARHAIQGASLFGLETHGGADGREHTRLHGYSAGRFELVDAVGGPRVRVQIFPRRLFTGPGGRRIDRDVQGYVLDERGSFAFEAPAGKL